jgi:hypothetical protein
MKIIKLFAFIVLFLCTAAFSQSQNNREGIFKNFNPKSYICYMTDKPLKIDGKLNEESWQKAKWTDCFTDIVGESGPVPRFKTKVKMLWDKKYLYIAAELEEPDIQATLRQRDTIIFYDNDFEVFIDPDGDTQQYYEFEMNALNTVWELLLIRAYRDQGSAINGFDMKGLKTATNIEGTINKPGDKDKGWTAEIAFPWLALQECSHMDTIPKNGTQWRINFSRVEWKFEVKDGKYKKVINPNTNRPYPEDNWVWSPQGSVDMHKPDMWGFLQFSDKIAGRGEDQFVYNSDEDYKWALRQIYYKEREFFEKNNRFTDKLNDLMIENVKLDGKIWEPVIQITESMYEATLKIKDSDIKWHISNEGRTWKQ